jgi:hypothetical protein
MYWQLHHKCQPLSATLYYDISVNKWENYTVDNQSSIPVEAGFFFPLFVKDSHQHYSTASFLSNAFTSGKAAGVWSWCVPNTQAYNAWYLTSTAWCLDKGIILPSQLCEICNILDPTPTLKWLATTDTTTSVEQNYGKACKDVRQIIPKASGERNKFIPVKNPGPLK